MAEYQITSWRDIPSMVVSREGDDTHKLQLSHRLQEAIDEAAMRLGQVGSDEYLAGWTRSEWAISEGGPVDVARQVAEELEAEWSTERIADYLESLS